MWIWILLVASPFLLLIVLEETINFFVQRHVFGPSHKSNKFVDLFKKFRVRSSVEKTTSL